MPEGFTYLSWFCSISNSVLCSVTTVSNCWLVCVWQERQDCHLCGIITKDTYFQNIL